mmetsp:Transcript_3508/g.8736  ORF Transcript_3508/g.8736 Transcript_3508/m.8736 type:complete len:92 (-) Transcript_3508:65-340(-)
MPAARRQELPALSCRRQPSEKRPTAAAVQLLRPLSSLQQQPSPPACSSASPAAAGLSLTPQDAPPSSADTPTNRARVMNRDIRNSGDDRAS